MESNKFPKLVDLINTYYSFVLFIYAIALYVASHTHLFLLSSAVLTIALAVWIGFAARTFYERRTQRRGFRVVSDVMTYEVGRHNKYVLRYKTTIEAKADHLIVYPLGHQWTGSGQESMPQVIGKGQTILAQIKPPEHNQDTLHIVPYILTNPVDGDWQYWFVALNPPLHRGDITDIAYSQDFTDPNNTAKPTIYYSVRTSMKRLELRVQFPKSTIHKKITASYAKSSDRYRPYVSSDIHYDADRQQATWIIEKPKTGYTYRLTHPHFTPHPRTSGRRPGTSAPLLGGARRSVSWDAGNARFAW